MCMFFFSLSPSSYSPFSLSRPLCKSIVSKELKRSARTLGSSGNAVGRESAARDTGVGRERSPTFPKAWQPDLRVQGERADWREYRRVGLGSQPPGLAQCSLASSSAFAKILYKKGLFSGFVRGGCKFGSLSIY